MESVFVGSRLSCGPAHPHPDRTPQACLAAALLLFRAGHIQASGAVARLAIERHLKGVCKQYPQLRQRSLPTASVCVRALFTIRVIDRRTSKVLRRIVDLANRMAHGANIAPGRVAELLRCTRVILTCWNESPRPAAIGFDGGSVRRGLVLSMDGKDN